MIVNSQQVRATLARLIKERRTSARALSLALRRNPAYIQQFIMRGSPARLEEQDRRVLASVLGIGEEELGVFSNPDDRDRELIQVRRLAVEASAGPGTMVGEEQALRRFGFDRLWLGRLTSSRPEQLSLISVKGDSMAPTLIDGDDALIDHAQADPRYRDGVYVLRHDDTLMIKRLSRAPTSSTLTISSDNSAYPTWRECPLQSISVIGRAIWVCRNLR